MGNGGTMHRVRVSWGTVGPCGESVIIYGEQCMGHRVRVYVVGNSNE